MTVSSTSPKPVVKFTLKDASGRPIVGLDQWTTKSATATAASYPNVNFALSKLVPGVNKSSDQWVSYIVTSVPLTNQTGTPSCPNDKVCTARPSTDNTGTLVGDGQGGYTYTFYRNVTTVPADVAAATNPTTYTTPDKADLGNLTFDATLQHRLVIQISGAARGTGSNTPTAAASGVSSVNLENPVNALYDFVPATGPIAKTAEAKYVVDISSCNQCHNKLAFHGGGRIDTQYCTVCHTTQRGFGQAKVVSTNLAFPADASPSNLAAAPGLKETATVNATTGITSYSYAPNVYVGDGEPQGTFVTFIHKIHNGDALQKVNYNYANVAFNLKGFSMLDDGQRMCTVCHNPAVAPKAEYAYSKPTRQACGACHDGINFATGQGTTIGGDTGGHVGRAQANDSLCDACHSAATTKVDHRTLNVTQNNPTVTDGLVSFTYLIDSATVDAAGNATVVFAIQQQTAPSTAKTFVSLPIDQSRFSGSPAFLFPYALTQDGVTAPADYNNFGRSSAQPRSVGINTLTLTAVASKPGYYSATVAGAYPAGATMRSVALQGYWSQIAAPGSVAAPVGRHAISVVKTVTGDTARRQVVDATKCANCHEWFEGHGGNRVIGKETGSNAEVVCVVCHVPGLATSGRGISDATMTSWAWTAADNQKLREWGMKNSSNAFIQSTNIALGFPVVTNNFKEMIHGIHAGRDRVVPFQDARDRTPGAINLLDFRRMDFPGTLSNCEGCHKPGTYNSVPAKALASVFESRNATYVATPTPANAKASLATANPEDTTQTPFAAACFSCHDNNTARNHMTQNGAKLNVNRSNLLAGGVFVNTESCQVCHGAGSEWDTAVVHK